ncbi:tail fiber domain-containing protein [Halovivax cerinus]|uniref:Tail fiber domain-containing protein n=1 Tax=Halovivax cerinus TaxID=1487865 RepID=A0ABD5NMH0_9EURY|nr:tail fiber domain-containing protein [Halovivax cerinus]
MPDADIILEKDWTNVIRDLRLGTEDGALADLRMYNQDGDDVIHLSAVQRPGFDASITAVGEAGLLTLGGAGTAGVLRFLDPDGDEAIEIHAGPKISLSSDQGNTTLSGKLVSTNLITADRVSSGEMAATRGRIRDLDVGGEDGSEDPQPGTVTVHDDQNEVTVEVDGQTGSIRHQGNISALSDARVKHGVEPLDGALETVTQLRGVRYEWDDDIDADLSLDDDSHVGFLAQDVERVFPEAVDEDGKGWMGTVDDAFTPILVEAIKEQQAMLAEQSETIAAQAETIESHEETIESHAETVDAQAERVEAQRETLAAQSRTLDAQADRIETLESRLEALERAVETDAS